MNEPQGSYLPENATVFVTALYVLWIRKGGKALCKPIKISYYPGRVTPSILVV